MLYNLIIAPIETIVDWVFLFINSLTSSYGVIYSVVGVSLVINFLALPLYNIADRLQEKERLVSKKMEYRVKRIKKAFKGDEQFMMLSTYYKQNDYHPLYVLRSSFSILIQIPFFMAAYNYLSNSEILLGSKFWIFNDLGKPDALFSLSLFGTTIIINTLPILMTLINFVSGAIYTKDAPLKEKVQVYLVAIIFLVLLYNSPAGLVIYWILNNIFSLVKNIVMKMKNPKKVTYLSILVIAVLGLLFVCYKRPSTKVFIFAFGVLCILLIPALISFLKKSKPTLFENKINFKVDKTNFFITLFAGLGISLLAGFLLPSNVIATSPQEFSFLGNTDNPLSYVFSSFCVYLGFFCLWPLCIYKMFGDNVKKYEPLFLVSLLIIFLLNAYVFKSDYGTVNIWFQLDNQEVLRNTSRLISILSLGSIFASILLYILLNKYDKRAVFSVILFAICLAETGMSFFNVKKINTEYKTYQIELSSIKENKDNQADADSNLFDSVYHLSKTNKNVVVLFLDRAVSSFFPQVLDELPQLKDQYKGFTYYPNSVSFCTSTDLSVPTLLGGYEYTPDRINERSTELLKDKHNESILVMPTLFGDAGYEVTMVDVPNPDYRGNGVLSTLRTGNNYTWDSIKGKYANYYKQGNVVERESDEITRKEIRNFSMLQLLPIDLRGLFYSNCRIEQIETDSFYDSFASLYYMRDLTAFDSTSDTFTFIGNETPHQFISLIAPEYDEVDSKRHNYRSNPKINISVQEHYDSFASSMIQVGKWLDYLRENGVYDNTRIIIVSDHGYNLPLDRFKSWGKNCNTPSRYNCLFMVKDFNANDPVITDNTFMTTADTLFVAKEGLGLSDTNPNTGSKLVQEKDDGVVVYPIYKQEWNTSTMKEKTQFTLEDDKVFLIKDDILIKENWIPLVDYKKSKEEK